MPPSVEYQQAPQNNQGMADRGMKRSLAPGTLPKQPKKPRLIKLDPRTSPLQYLNTMRPGLNFQVERTVGGTAHEPRFSVTVVVDGCIYRGMGKSKQHAKQYAATEALKVMLNDPGLHYVDDSPRANPIPVMVPVAEVEPPDVSTTAAPPVRVGRSEGGTGAPSIIGKTPVQILNEMDTSAVYECVAEDPINLPRRFTMIVTVKGVTYRAFGANKKQAKQAAARAALTAMGTPVEGPDASIEETLTDMQDGTQSGKGKNGPNFADRLGTKVLDRFEDVMRNRPDKKPWKVIAGTGGRPHNGAFATGPRGQQHAQYHQTTQYKPASYSQRPSPQQQLSQPHYRPVVKRSSGLYAVKFVPAANGQTRTSWPANGTSNGLGGSFSGGGAPDAGLVNGTARYQSGGRTPYQSHVGHSDSSTWYGYERYRPPGRGPTVPGAVIQLSPVRAGGSGGGGGGHAAKAVSFAQSVSSSQPQWARGWAESADWQYHSSGYYGNGDAIGQDVSTSHYNTGWEFGYGQDGGSYRGYSSAVAPSQVVVAGAPQQYAQGGDGRSVSEHNLWGGRY
ncbi:double-stranded RNA-specific editase 1-like [Tropilaelaps mercedesae]|uniref:Double-stranded RNA-specific editase 1-like n=1 Tax=Tropilaelaps mercedesae TaxID=418985 RepID=A0A1V9XBU0_9ACAR|nr:double-stranded RNA-specific editase 1-like [Tropilaelaps mercedesae]